MKDKLTKRKRVNWRDVMLDINRPDIEADFLLMLQKHPRMSVNRICWNVLRRYYSTTTLLLMRFDYGKM